MKLWIQRTFLLSLSCCALFAEAPITFEVASIKPSKPVPMGQMRIMMGGDAEMLRYSNVSLKDCVRVAYRVKDFQVQGPDWMGSERFDIVAKLPAGSTREQIPEMLQALLTERFKLTLHRDSKEHAIYALVAAKNGPKLKAAEVSAGGATPGPGGPGGDKGGMPRGAMQMMMSPEGAHLKAPTATLANLAEMLSRFTERPVVDSTGIQGQYDFDLVFAPETMRNMPGGGGPMLHGGGAERPAEEAPVEKAGSIYESVQKYGLKLEPRKAPMEILIVDHLEKTPTEN